MTFFLIYLDTFPSLSLPVSFFVGKFLSFALLPFLAPSPSFFFPLMVYIILFSCSSFPSSSSAYSCASSSSSRALLLLHPPLPRPLLPILASSFISASSAFCLSFILLCLILFCLLICFVLFGLGLFCLNHFYLCFILFCIRHNVLVHSPLWRLLQSARQPAPQLPRLGVRSYNDR